MVRTFEQFLNSQANLLNEATPEEIEALWQTAGLPDTVKDDFIKRSKFLDAAMIKRNVIPALQRTAGVKPATAAARPRVGPTASPTTQPTTDPRSTATPPPAAPPAGETQYQKYMREKQASMQQAAGVARGREDRAQGGEEMIPPAIRQSLDVFNDILLRGFTAGGAVPENIIRSFDLRGANKSLVADGLAVTRGGGGQPFYMERSAGRPTGKIMFMQGVSLPQFKSAIADLFAPKA